MGETEPGDGAGGAATAWDMDVEAGTAGPRVAAGGADVGAADGQDGTGSVSTGGEAVIDADGEGGAGGATVTGVARAETSNLGNCITHNRSVTDTDTLQLPRPGEDDATTSAASTSKLTIASRFLS